MAQRGRAGLRAGRENSLKGATCPVGVGARASLLLQLLYFHTGPPLSGTGWDCWGVCAGPGADDPREPLPAEDIL